MAQNDLKHMKKLLQRVNLNGNFKLAICQDIKIPTFLIFINTMTIILKLTNTVIKV